MLYQSPKKIHGKQLMFQIYELNRVFIYTN